MFVGSLQNIMISIIWMIKQVQALCECCKENSQDICRISTEHCNFHSVRSTRLFAATSSNDSLSRHMSTLGSLLMSRPLFMKSKKTTLAFSPTDYMIHHDKISQECGGNYIVILISRTWWIWKLYRTKGW